MQALAEMCKVLKPGGTALVYNIRKDVPDEKKVEFKRRYGRIVAFGLGFVSRHAELNIEEARELVASVVGYSNSPAEESGIYIRIKLRK